MRKPDTLLVDGHAFSWRRLTDLRRQQLEAVKAEEARQLELFELKLDCRPTAQCTAAGRYQQPTRSSTSSAMTADCAQIDFDCTKRFHSKSLLDRTTLTGRLKSSSIIVLKTDQRGARCIGGCFRLLSHWHLVRRRHNYPPIDKLPAELRAQLSTSTTTRPLSADPKIQRDAITAHANADKEKAKLAASMIGLGWDIWKGELAAKCAEAKTVLRIPIGPNGKNPHNIDKYGQIETVTQYHDNRSSGINFDLTYELVSFSFGTSTGSQTSFKSTSKFIDIYKRSVGDEYKGSEWKPTNLATGLLGNPTQFGKTCGQRFITRVGFGIQLDTQLAANIEVNEKAETNKTQVGIGFGDLIGFGANSADTVTELRKHAQLSVHLAGASGEGPKPEDLIEYARTFGNVADVDGSFQTVFVETRSYAEFPSFKKFVDLSTKATGTLLLFTADRLRALQQFEDIKTAVDKPNFIKVTDLAGAPVTDLDMASKAQAAFLDKLSAVYTTCSAAITDALVKKCQDEAAAVGAPPVKLRFELINQQP